LDIARQKGKVVDVTNIVDVDSIHKRFLAVVAVRIFNKGGRWRLHDESG